MRTRHAFRTLDAASTFTRRTQTPGFATNGDTRAVWWASCALSPRASVQWRQGRMETTGRCCTGHAKTPPGRPPRPCLCRQTGLETPAQRPVPGGPPSHAVSLSPQRLAHTGRESPSWSRAPCPNPLTTSLPVQECRPCALGVCPCQRSRGDMPGLRRGAGPARVPGRMDVGTGCQRLSRSAAATPLLTRAVV